MKTETQEDTLKEELQANITEDITDTNIANMRKRSFSTHYPKKNFLMLDNERPIKSLFSLESSLRPATSKYHASESRTQDTTRY